MAVVSTRPGIKVRIPVKFPARVTAQSPIIITQVGANYEFSLDPDWDFGFVHTQSVASDTWTIDHNLGLKPVISLYDNSGVEFDAQVTHVSENQAVANLTVATAGFARCV